MVPLEKNNAYQLRDYLLGKVIENANSDPFKSCLLLFLGLKKNVTPVAEFSSLSLYQRCAIAGLGVTGETVSSQDILRLLGQAAKFDSTPQPWVSDIFGVMAVKWLVKQMGDSRITREFENWAAGFLRQQNNGSRLNILEKDVVDYVQGESATYKSACVPLFLHYQKIHPIDDHQSRLSLIDRFMCEFRAQADGDAGRALLSIMIYVFNMVSNDVAIAPPKGWSLSDLLNFLEHIPVGLKRWTWEEGGRTRGAAPIKWRRVLTK